jgi:hypothetical protein
MLELYDADAGFEDPMFGTLDARQTRGMWRMLTRSGQGVHVSLRDAWANDTAGGVHVDSEFIFPQTSNTVHNQVEARFKFKAGKIVHHTENYDLQAWIRMALGVSVVTSELEVQFKAQFQNGLAQILAAMPE